MPCAATYLRMIREIFEADSFSADAACALWARRINCSTVSVLPTCEWVQVVEVAGALLMVTADILKAATELVEGIEVHADKPRTDAFSLDEAG
jgi:hypothetical protein